MSVQTGVSLKIQETDLRRFAEIAGSTRALFFPSAAALVCDIEHRKLFKDFLNIKRGPGSRRKMRSHPFAKHVKITVASPNPESGRICRGCREALVELMRDVSPVVAKK